MSNPNPFSVHSTISFRGTLDILVQFLQGGIIITIYHICFLLVFLFFHCLKSRDLRPFPSVHLFAIFFFLLLASIWLTWIDASSSSFTIHWCKKKEITTFNEPTFWPYLKPSRFSYLLPRHQVMLSDYVHTWTSIGFHPFSCICLLALLVCQRYMFVLPFNSQLAVLQVSSFSSVIYLCSFLNKLQLLPTQPTHVLQGKWGRALQAVM